MLLPLLPGFNGPATEAEPKIIIMRENEIHICKGEEDKVEKNGRRARIRRAIAENTRGGEERRDKETAKSGKK